MESVSDGDIAVESVQQVPQARPTRGTHMTVMNDFNDTMTFALLTIQFYSVIGLILSDNAMLSHVLLATLTLPAIPLLSHAVSTRHRGTHTER